MNAKKLSILLTFLVISSIAILPQNAKATTIVPLALNPMDDTQIQSAAWSASTNWGGDPAIGVSNWYGSNAMTLIQFDLNTIPATATIISAQLYIFARSDFTNSQYFGPVYVAPITSPWTEETATWNTKPSISPIFTTVTTIGATAVNTPITWDLKSDVQKMVSGEMINNGWCLYTDASTFSGDFHSKEGQISVNGQWVAAPQFYPTLVITYEPKDMTVVPEYALGGLAAIGACFTALFAFKNKQKSIKPTL